MEVEGVSFLVSLVDVVCMTQESGFTCDLNTSIVGQSVFLVVPHMLVNELLLFSWYIYHVSSIFSMCYSSFAALGFPDLNSKSWRCREFCKNQTNGANFTRYHRRTSAGSAKIQSICAKFFVNLSASMPRCFKKYSSRIQVAFAVFLSFWINWNSRLCLPKANLEVFVEIILIENYFLKIPVFHCFA